jgi:hypothetical protein
MASGGPSARTRLSDRRHASAEAQSAVVVFMTNTSLTDRRDNRQETPAMALQTPSHTARPAHLRFPIISGREGRPPVRVLSAERKKR